MEWFRQSLAAHSFKDLEKALPAVASVNKMQIKDFIQSLTDEGLIRVEKIGGGNWYWSFISDAKKIKENALDTLTTEESRLKASIADIEAELEEDVAAREEGEETLGDSGMDRKTLLETHETLLRETSLLDKELSSYSDNDPTEILRKAEEIKRLKESAEKWTDYIEGVEWILKNQMGDKVAVAHIMENICGDEYVPGEGLREL